MNLDHQGGQGARRSLKVLQGHSRGTAGAQQGHSRGTAGWDGSVRQYVPYTSPVKHFTQKWAKQPHPRTQCRPAVCCAAAAGATPSHLVGGRVVVHVSREAAFGGKLDCCGLGQVAWVDLEAVQQQYSAITVHQYRPAVQRQVRAVGRAAPRTPGDTCCHAGNPPCQAQQQQQQQAGHTPGWRPTFRSLASPPPCWPPAVPRWQPPAAPPPAAAGRYLRRPQP